MNQLILDGELPEAQRMMLEQSQSAAQALLGILNDILDFSKVESGLLSLNPQPVSFGSFLEETCHLFDNQLSAKGLDFSLRIDPRIPAVLLLDELRLGQVIRNLLGNAVKFTEKGRVEVEAVLREWTPAGLVLGFTVQDTGLGINDEQKANLFKVFSQGDQSITRKFGGTGLGLAISSRLVGLLGGSLTVESASGVGSTFRFTIACTAPAGISEIPDGKDPSPAATKMIRFPGSRVLLVEDNPLNQQVAGEFLRRRGILVEIASDGLEAVALTAERRYDLICMDLHMPGIDGIETCRRIKSREKNRNIPILAMTAAVLPEDRQRCRDAGMIDFIAKPIEPEALVQTLKKYLKVEASGTGDEVSPVAALARPLLFDPADALHRLAGNAVLLSSLVHQFAEQIEVLLNQMEKYRVEGNLPQMEQIAHTLKGTAGNLGMKPLYDMAAAAAAAAHSGTVPDLRALGEMLVETKESALAWARDSSGREIDERA
jgi:CheY-like chemotaxis protein/HPt (histidine-containing phosphotransfer) domain-containing protein/two-component sensor histidine kinase